MLKSPYLRKMTKNVIKKSLYDLLQVIECHQNLKDSPSQAINDELTYLPGIFYASGLAAFEALLCREQDINYPTVMDQLSPVPESE